MLFLFLYFINFGIERTNTNRFGFRIVRKTKEKKLQAVKETEFYDVTSSYAGADDNYYGGKKRKKASKRNKVGADLMPSFVDVRTPPAVDNFNACNSDLYLGSSCDLFCPEDDTPGPSGVCVKNEVIMDLTGDNDWLDTGKRNEKKSVLSNFLSKFKCGPSHQRS